MTYDAQLTTRRDEIRLMGFDTADPHMIPDVTIDALLASYGDWRLAAADALTAIAVQLDRKLTGLGDGGDSLQWADRAKTVRATAQRLRSEVSADAAYSRFSGFGSVAAERDDVTHAEYVNTTAIHPWGD